MIDWRLFSNFSQESNAWVEQIIAKIRQVLTTFKYQHISKAPTADVINAPTEQCGAAPGAGTVDARNNNAAPAHKLCDSIANNNDSMKKQLKFLLEHLSESYE